MTDGCSVGTNELMTEGMTKMAGHTIVLKLLNEDYRNAYVDIISDKM